MTKTEEKLDKIIKLLEEIKVNQAMVFYPPVYYPPFQWPPYVPYPEPPYITYTSGDDGTSQIDAGIVVYNS